MSDCKHEHTEGEPFVHLHVHTDYSLLDGCATPETYAEEAARMGQPALAVTDHGDMGAVFRHWDSCRKHGIKPILGVECYINPGRDMHPIPQTLRRRIEKALDGASKQEKEIFEQHLARLLEENDDVRDCEAQARKQVRGAVDIEQALREAGIDPMDKKRYDFLVEQEAKGIKQKEEGVSTDDYKAKDKHLILLAKNEVGYRNLSTIVSEAHINGFYRKPRTTPDVIRSHSEGIICLSACLGSETSRAILNEDLDEARRLMLFYKEVFGDDYYAEIQSNELDDQKLADYGLMNLADDLGVKKVATVDCHYCFKGHDKIQDALLAKARRTRLDDPNIWKFDVRRLWLKNMEELVNEYGEFGFEVAPSDIREACATTLEIADKCEGDYMEWGQFQFPNFDTGDETPDGMLWRLCVEGFKYRLAKGFIDPDDKRKYARRLKDEYDVICEKEFATYFLVVQDMVMYAKNRRIFVGGGRGSVAGSLVAYMLRITEVDPLRFGLIFERFLNAGRSGKTLRIRHKRLTPVQVV